MEIRYKIPDRIAIRRNVLKGVPMFDTEFKRESTPSFSKCIDALVELEIDYRERCDKMQYAIFRKWTRHLSEKKAMKVSGLVNEALLAGPTEASRRLEHPPSSLSMTEKKLYKELLVAGHNLNYELALAKFPIQAAPCMFEPKDIGLDEQRVLDPSMYKPHHTKFGLQYHSRRIALRNVMDPNYPLQRLQSIDFSVTVSPNKDVVLKYTVYNRNDKLDSVVFVGDRLIPSHYHVELKTARGEKEFYFSFEITRSSRSGDFTIKYEDASNTFPSFVTSKDIIKDPMYKMLYRYPVFMGGNAFLSISDFVREHRGEIVGNLTRYTNSM